VSEKSKKPLLGLHAIEESIKSGQKGELLVSKRNKRIDGLVDLARARAVAVRTVREEELERLAAGLEHRGAAFLPLPVPASGPRKPELFPRHGDSRLVILLGGVTDPQNLGAILRSADQFSADSVIVPLRRSAHLSEAVASASAGASAWVPLSSAPNLPQVMNDMKKAGYWLYGADSGGQPAERVDLRGSIGLVMGSEGKGLSRLVRQRCDGLIRIPSSGRVDSFNVSVACGILMYEIRRQQRFYAG
jgi:23S rRNA (guanosine2251-2'-O)-methyltransferase